MTRMATSVSYLVTLYNKAVYVPLVVQSLINQTGDFDREYIFVDDGSTDETLAVLRQTLADLSPAWPVHIITQSNQGPSAAFNAGLALASSEWLKPMDGDDVLLPNATEVLLAAATDLKTDIAHAPMKLQGTYQLTDAGQFPHVQSAAAQKIDMLWPSLKKAQTNPSTWFARRSVVQQLGGCNADVFIQDYWLELKLAQHSPWAEIPACIMLQPALTDGRLSNNLAQTLHDVNLALLLFVDSSRSLLAPAHIRYALRHAASRAWKWARRKNNTNWFLRAFWNYLLACLNMLRLERRKIIELCAPFHADQNLKCKIITRMTSQ